MPSRSANALAGGRAAGHTALLIIDMISGWDFPDAGKLLPGALEIAPRIASLKARCRRDGVPVIYANDNRGLWRSDFRMLVEASLGAGGPAARIASSLRPDADDYFILKPRHSAFFRTPLELLLKDLKVERLVLTGVSTDQCVAMMATDARMREFEVIVPRDAVATQTRARNDACLRQLETAFGMATTSARHLRILPARTTPR